MILGTGDYRYEFVNNWGIVPEGWRLGEVGGIGIDDSDRVYVFNRGEHPMMVFDRDGNFLTSWGEGIFLRPHGVHMAPDGTIYCTDDGDHSVRRCTLDGKVLLTLGIPGQSSGFMSGKPFCKCTHTALSPQGDIYVSDGYGNNCVHKFSADGKHLLTWGQPGIGAGEFNLPHNISCDPDGWVYVADRENHRIQIFDGNGKYQTEWNHIHRPSGIHMPRCSCPICYVGEIGPYMKTNRGVRNLGPRISILDNNGKLLSRLETQPSAGAGDGQFLSPHGLAVDSRGDLYVGEVSYTAWPSLFPDQPRPELLPVIRKLVKQKVN
ncbi:MAG TPA: peptidyl-alpha-hydroxyglycine alpha-amidating lyase family protein [Devosiaceae bacterium]